MTASPINRVILYVRDLDKVASFYERHFLFERAAVSAGEKVVLKPRNGGCALVLLRAAKTQKQGQSLVKLVFDVADIAAAKVEQARLGLRFGVIHRGPGYLFSNARDPAKNLIQISNAYEVDGAQNA